MNGSPGFIDTDMTVLSDEIRNDILSKIPLEGLESRRCGSIMAFLASDYSSYIRQVINVDGGI